MGVCAQVRAIAVTAGSVIADLALAHDCDAAGAGRSAAEVADGIVCQVPLAPLPPPPPRLPPPPLSPPPHLLLPSLPSPLPFPLSDPPPPPPLTQAPIRPPTRPPRRVTGQPSRGCVLR